MDPKDTLENPARLRALETSGLPDSPAEERFDRTARLAARLLRTPTALVSLVGADRLFFKGTLGLEGSLAGAREAAHDQTFCRLVVARAAPVAVGDARAAGTPAAVRNPAVVAYLGVPLVCTGGAVLGTLCVIDRSPRAWTDEDVQTLDDLAAGVVAEINLSLANAALRRANGTPEVHTGNTDPASGPETVPALDTTDPSRTAGPEAADPGPTARAIWEAREAAESANRAKTDFLTAMSHEARAPLAAVLEFADMLLDPAISAAESSRAVLAIRRNAVHLLSVLDNMLDLAKVETGSLEIGPRACSPWELALEADGLLRGTFRDRHITLRTVPASSLPAQALLDPTRVRQVLVNLLHNALKFSKPGGVVSLRVAALSGTDDRLAKLEYEVEDQGVGISPDNLDKLFHPFQQVPGGPSPGAAFGPGLGLSISRRLVEAMGGVISARSEPGRGTCVTLRLPLIPPAGSPEIAWVEPEERRDDDPAPRTAGAPRLSRVFSGRILLAEDNPDNQQVLIYVLRRFGLTPDVVTNGREAVEAALARPYDLILMDMQMDEMDGYEAARLLRQSGYHLPIVAVTAHSLGSDREHCLAVGCDEYLTKPIDVGLLESVLTLHLGPGDVTPAAGATGAIRSDKFSDPGLRPLIRDYVAALPQRLQAIRDSFVAGDHAEVVGLTHQLKGSGAMYGYDSLSEAAGLLHLAVREGQEAELVRALVDELDHVVDRIVAGIERP